MLVLSGCTTVGVADYSYLKGSDFGRMEKFRICVLADEGVTEEEARSLMATVGEGFSMFGLEVSVPWVRPWPRPAFAMQGIIEDLGLQTLEAPCDRMFGLVGRNFGDFLVGLVGIEVLGAVDTVTHTRGFAVAKQVSLNQVFVSPTKTAIHETYHLLGCAHGTTLVKCYKRILDMKRIARVNRESGNDFFPGLSSEGVPIASRDEANTWTRDVVRRLQLQRSMKLTGQ